MSAFVSASLAAPGASLLNCNTHSDPRTRVGHLNCLFKKNSSLLFRLKRVRIVSIKTAPNGWIARAESAQENLQNDDSNGMAIVLVGRHRQDDYAIVKANFSFQKYGEEAALGLVVQSVTGRGWVTGSGLAGPMWTTMGSGNDSSGGFGRLINECQPVSAKSRRRCMRVEFTCNKCGERTMRMINPHAYTEGTVFVQCRGCDIFHKLVDNLGLFHELQGPIYTASNMPPGSPAVKHEPFEFL
eukprot:TRINITY_DN609_c0_g1_i1.p1 TRINITY_DN609_c0_g1~~TRINITY_DN609_c0_g1_i1.p1  ORF type:complete len:255 (-),score=35.20 TRINITY_DN609_c0_g1_i1:263-988(-)